MASRKRYFGPATLWDEKLKDGVIAVSYLSENPASRDNYFVVGGIATQSYLPKTLRRETSDIDLAITTPLTFSEFKKFSKTSAEYLNSRGYDIKLKKDQNAYQIIYKKGNESGIFDTYIIEFARRGKAYCEREKKRLEKEILNSREKPIEGTDLAYRVSSPEDIIIPKFVRSIGGLERYPDLKRYLDGFSGERSKSLGRNLGLIRSLREDVLLRMGEIEACERLRFVSDAFDIRALFNTTGINSQYFELSKKDWKKMENPSKEKDILHLNLLPEIDL